jgi:hypothetical protein
MGSGVFGGMIVATFVATIFIPLFFAVMSRKQKEAKAQQALPPQPDVAEGEA